MRKCLGISKGNEKNTSPVLKVIDDFLRDRTPFVLTSDMAFVINGGDKSTQRFHKFIDLCCQAFNIVRANGNLILNLFTFVSRLYCKMTMLFNFELF